MANGVGIPVSGSREEREGWFPNQWVGELQYLPVFVPVFLLLLFSELIPVWRADI